MLCLRLLQRRRMMAGLRRSSGVAMNGNTRIIGKLMAFAVTLRSSIQRRRPSG
jgi:hypothetical protein